MAEFNYSYTPKKSKTRVLSGIIVGLLFLAAGVVIGLDIFFDVELNLLFDGWWTLFIIIPSLFGLFNRKSVTLSISGLLFGGALLAYEQGLIGRDFSRWGMIWRAALLCLMINIGLVLIFGAFRKRTIHLSGEDADCTTVFGDRSVDYSGRVFTGASLDSVFGDITIDLRTAIISTDCTIAVNAVFGTVTIFASPNAVFVTEGNEIFGTLENKSVVADGEAALPTVKVVADSVFGTVKIV